MVGNLDKDTVRWLIDTLVGALAFVGGFWLTNLTNRVDATAKELAECSKRLAVVESQNAGFIQWRDRIEGKIDYLIERTAGRK